MKTLSLIPVEGHRHLGREPHSRAIINHDAEGLRKAKELKAKAEEKIAREKDIESRINRLESDVHLMNEKLDTILNCLTGKK